MKKILRWRNMMNKICKNCRFMQESKCVKFNVNVNEDYKACNDFADICLNESFSKEKMQLND